MLFSRGVLLFEAGAEEFVELVVLLLSRGGGLFIFGRGTKELGPFKVIIPFGVPLLL